MYELERCQVVPIDGHRASFQVAGKEVTRWNFGTEYPRPFLYPVLGPSGQTLTRMGHPGAPNHDHHQSVWFAHNKVLGIDFWGNNSGALIRQEEWLAYEDGPEFARMAVLLGWYDGHDPSPLVQQELIMTFRPLPDHEYTLEFESRFKPLADELEFQQTNFGFLAVRMAKSISAYFGGGQLTGTNGATGEPALFGEPNPWMDYSGPVLVPAADGQFKSVVEGITYFDHPQNPAFPAKWHVREDGWMGASACRDSNLIATREKPLHLRQMLFVHRGGVNHERNQELLAEWGARPEFIVQRSTRKHTHAEVIAVGF